MDHPNLPLQGLGLQLLLVTLDLCTFILYLLQTHGSPSFASILEDLLLNVASFQVTLNCKVAMVIALACCVECEMLHIMLEHGKGMVTPLHCQYGMNAIATNPILGALHNLAKS